MTDNDGQQQQADEEAQQTGPEDGDIYCEEDGEYVGNYEKIGTISIPIELSLFYKGYFFVYKLDRKEKEGE